MSLAGACTSSAANDESALPGPQEKSFATKKFMSHMRWIEILVTLYGISYTVIVFIIQINFITYSFELKTKRIVIIMWFTSLSWPDGSINPYRQIPETISKKRAVTQGTFRKLFPGKFHEYLPMKKYFPISGKSFRKFSWVITRIYEITNFI